MVDYTFKNFAYAAAINKDEDIENQIVRLLETDENNEFKYVSSDRDLLIEKMDKDDFCNPVFQILVFLLKPGDKLTITSLEVLGRTYQQIKDKWKKLRSLGIEIRVLDTPLISTTDYKDSSINWLVNDLVVQILDFVASKENKKEKMGSDEKRKRYGSQVKSSKPKLSLDEKLNTIKKVNVSFGGNLNNVETAKLIGISEATFYKYRKMIKEGISND